MKKLKALVLKNISGGQSRQFFAPLNRWVEYKATVDILKMCDGNSASAFEVVRGLRHNKNWQIFELFDGVPPAPEGEIDNRPAVSVAETPIDAAPEPKPAPRNGSKKAFPAKPQQAHKPDGGDAA